MKAIGSLFLLASFFLLASGAEAQIVGANGHSYGRPRDGYVSNKVWVPGRTEIVYERVWIPGRCERVWIEPAYRYQRDSCGRLVRVLACAGYWQTVNRPGYYESRPVRRCIPGAWVKRWS